MKEYGGRKTSSGEIGFKVRAIRQWRMRRRLGTHEFVAAGIVCGCVDEEFSTHVTDNAHEWNTESFRTLGVIGMLNRGSRQWRMQWHGRAGVWA